MCLYFNDCLSLFLRISFPESAHSCKTNDVFETKEKMYR